MILCRKSWEGIRAGLIKSAIEVRLDSLPKQPYIADVPVFALAALLKQMRDQEEGVDIDGEAAARMLLGSLLTYALLDGLLNTDGSPSLPESERLAAIVDLLLRAISTR